MRNNDSSGKIGLQSHSIYLGQGELNFFLYK